MKLFRRRKKAVVHLDTYSGRMWGAKTPVDRTKFFDYLSYGEVEGTPGCKCRPTNVLYWELSEADTSKCPIHGPGQEDA